MDSAGSRRAKQAFSQIEIPGALNEDSPREQIAAMAKEEEEKKAKKKEEEKMAKQKEELKQ